MGFSHRLLCLLHQLRVFQGGEVAGVILIVSCPTAYYKVNVLQVYELQNSWPTRLKENTLGRFAREPLWCRRKGCPVRRGGGLEIVRCTPGSTLLSSSFLSSSSDHLGLHGHCIVVGQDGLDIADGREKVPAQADGRAQHSGEDHYKRHACARPGA